MRQASALRLKCHASVIRALLNSILYSPSSTIVETPGDRGLPFRDLTFETEDGESLRGWWIGARTPSLGHVLFCH